MIRLPNTGVARSIRRHNSDLGVISDWVALSAISDPGEETSKSDVLDTLIEHQIYDEQDFCNEYLADVWRELRRRNRADHGLITIASNSCTTSGDWRTRAELVAPIVLTLGPRYEGWVSAFGDYVEQGRLFERVTLALVDSLFDAWEIMDVGWSPVGAPLVLADTVAGLGSRLRCTTRAEEIAKWAGSSAKDAGLDFALFREFSDSRGAYPAFLGQVASGGDWIGKLKEPDLAVWDKLISFVSRPQRAVVIPSVLDGDEFERRANQVEGLLIDRLRLYEGYDSDHFPNDLREEVAAWVEPRLDWLMA